MLEEECCFPGVLRDGGDAHIISIKGAE